MDLLRFVFGTLCITQKALDYEGRKGEKVDAK